MNKIRIFNGNTLKIIAAVCMFIDHMGFMLFPNITLFRIIGRLAFPIFAFMIAEGARYTKNKIKYFSLIFILAVIFQFIYYFFQHSLKMSVLVTFSLSILVIYSFQFFKWQLSKPNNFINSMLAFVVIIVAIMFVFTLNLVFDIDYGFTGCMLPVFASIFHNKTQTKACQVLNCHYVSLICFSIGLLLVCIFSGWNIQYYSLIAIALLLLYNGTRGKLKLKYFFYIFYPVHLVLLYVIDLLI